MPMFNGRQIDRMRADAIRRSQEMYRRSVNDTDKTVPLPAVSDEQILSELPPPAEVRMVNNGGMQNSLNELVNDILGNSLDGDRLLLLVLLFLLIREGADIKLIIALGYILL